MDFYVVRPDPDHEGEVTRDVFYGADARYWFEQGGVLVASGHNEDSYRSWRAYAPGTWLRVEANGSPAVQGEPLSHPKQSDGVPNPFHDETPAAGG